MEKTLLEYVDESGVSGKSKSTSSIGLIAAEIVPHPVSHRAGLSLDLTDAAGPQSRQTAGDHPLRDAQRSADQQRARGAGALQEVHDLALDFVAQERRLVYSRSRHRRPARHRRLVSQPPAPKQGRCENRADPTDHLFLTQMVEAPRIIR